AAGWAATPPYPCTSQNCQPDCPASGSPKCASARTRADTATDSPARSVRSSLAPPGRHRSHQYSHSMSGYKPQRPPKPSSVVPDKRSAAVQVGVVHASAKAERAVQAVKGIALVGYGARVSEG